MLKLNLILRRKSDDIMIFSPAPWFRILFLFIAAVLISGIIILFNDNGEWNFSVASTIAVVCIIASLYEESWTFNKTEQTIVYRSGIVFLYKSKNYSFTEIENFELMSFIRGSKPDSPMVSREAQINLFSRDISYSTKDIGQKKNYPNYHQELRLNLKSGNFVIIENQKAHRTDILTQNTFILSDFCGIPIINK